MCPEGMLKNPSWRTLVERYIAASVSPLQDWPEGYTAWAHDGIVELRIAIRAEEDRQLRERQKQGSGAGAGSRPVWRQDRRSARPGGEA